MIQDVLATLIHAIVPISIPVIAGALLAHYKKLDTKPLLVLFLYFFIPALIFDTLLTAEIIMGDVYKTLAFSVLNLLLLWGLANVLGKLLKLPSAETAGLTLVSTFTNSVNYGLPLVLLTFGQLGLDKASIYIIIQIVIVNTVGIYFAARSQFSVKGAFKTVFSLPAIYAALLALIFRAFNLHLPTGIETGISLVAGAYAPVVLVILGAQMVSVKAEKLEQSVQVGFWTGMSVRLLLSPFLALFCLYILKVDGILFSVLFILACMPVAVNSVVLAEKFDAYPKLVSKTILWTTLASFIILPILIGIVS